MLTLDVPAGPRPTMLSDREYMTRALCLAERGRGRTAPNPLVGAVVVTTDGVIAGQGFHERAGGPHAEVYALGGAGAQARGATLYSTLEPCCHTGRTGPCAERIAAAGIMRVVAATSDPFPLVCGGGFEYLRARGIQVEVGVGRDAALRQNAAFFTSIRHHRPFVTMKVATSLDGCIAGARGVRSQLTSEPAVRHVHHERASVDAVAIGSTTVLVDDPLLTARRTFRERPLVRVVFDRRLRTPPGARLLRTLEQGPVIIMTTTSAVALYASRAEALKRAGATIEPLAQEDIGSALERLAALGLGSVLLEGGAAVHASAWRAGVVDRVQLYVSPVVLGDSGVPWMPGVRFSTAGLCDVRILVLGSDILIEGDVHRPD